MNKVYFKRFSFLFLWVALSIYSNQLNGQTMSYMGPNSYNVSDASFQGVSESFSVFAQETAPSGLAFSSDGAKMFIVGLTDRNVVEYNLSTSFDVSTATYAGASEEFSIGSQESLPRSLAFSTDGTKMFILGSNDNAVVEYSLSSAFDVSTSSYSGIGEEFSVSSQESDPRGLAFNNDGTKMFIIGDNGNSVVEYSLSIAFDVSTSTYSGISEEFSVNSEESVPQGLFFNKQGDKMFVFGNDQNTVKQYSLSTDFDVSTASYDGVSKDFGFASQETIPQTVSFNNDGGRMYVLGITSDAVNEYTIDKGDYIEAVANDGSIDGSNSIIIDIEGDTFQDADADDLLDLTTEVVMNNVPLNLVPVFTLSNSDTRLTITFTGNATNNQNADDISTLTFTFNNAAFTGNDASNVLNSGFGGAYDAEIGIDFENDGALSYSQAFDFKENSTNNGSIDNSTSLVITLSGNGIVFQDVDDDNVLDVGGAAEVEIANVPPGLLAVMTLSEGDTKVTLSFTGNATNHKNVNDVSSLTFEFKDAAFTGANAADIDNSGSVVAFDSGVGIDFLISKVNYIGPASYAAAKAVYNGIGEEFSVSSQELSPTAISFSNDGMKLFILGSSSDAIVTYNLVTAFDVSTSVYAGISEEFSVAAQEISPRGMAFNNDGKKIFIIGTENASVVEYSLTSAYKLSTATYEGVGEEFSVSAQETDPRGISFNNNGTKMFIIGASGDAVIEYSLASAYDVSTASYNGLAEEFSVASQETVPQDLVFNNDGTLMYVIGSVNDAIIQYRLSTGFDVSTASYSGVTNELSIASQETLPQGIAYNNNGSKVFIVGSSGDAVIEYSIDPGDFKESALNNGTIDNGTVLVVELTEDTFADGDADDILDVGSEITINNIPSNLIASVALSNGDTRATITLNGTAVNNDNTDDVSSLTFTFLDAAFSNSLASDIDNSGDGAAFDPGVGVDFISNSPGGVATSLALWLKAGTGTTGNPTVSIWADQSVNANTLNNTGDPSLTANGINYNPTITLDGNDFFTHSDPGDLPNGSSVRTYIAVGKSADTGTTAGQEGFFSHGSTAASQEIGITLNSNSERASIAFNGTRRGVTAGTNQNPELTTFILSGTNTNTLSIAANGQTLITSLISGADATMNTGTALARLGADMSGANGFNGDISEFITYSQALNAADKQKVESYLAIKYGITLSDDTNGDGSVFEAPNADGINEGDYIDSNGGLIWDASLDRNYHHGIGIIGRDDVSGLNQKQSKSSNAEGILTVGLDNDNDGLESSNALNPNEFDDDLSFFMWGHDDADLNSGSAGENEFDNTQVNARSNREWRVREVGLIGAVILQFDISTLLGPDNMIGTNDESQVVLLVDEDGDFSSGAEIKTQAHIVNGDGLVNFSVNFLNGNYFTLASSEQSALPVSLLDFQAISRENYVQLNWSTVSEENNDYFAIERSSNGKDFRQIGQLNGAGNSDVIIKYSFRDEDPRKGFNYYRLKDVDSQGNFEYSWVASSFFNSTLKADGIYPFPNPVKSGGMLTIKDLRANEINSATLVSYQGESYDMNVSPHEFLAKVSIKKNVPSGLYILQVSTEGDILRWRIIIE